MRGGKDWRLETFVQRRTGQLRTISRGANAAEAQRKSPDGQKQFRHMATISKMRKLGDTMDQIEARARDTDGWASGLGDALGAATSVPTTPAFAQGRAAAMARKRWRALRNLRDELLRPPAGVLDPTLPEHPLHPAHAVQQDVRAVLGRPMLQVARYRATASTFAALLASQFDMPQEVRASPLLARVFFAFARDRSVGGNGDPELARTSGRGGVSQVSASTPLGPPLALSSAGVDQGADADSDSARGWAWWDSNDDDDEVDDDEDGGDMLSLALQSRDSASAIDPRAHSPLRRIGTATDMDASGRASAIVTMAELSVDMRAVVCALMILFPPSNFESLTAAAQLQQLFDIYATPESVAARTHVATTRGMKHHLATPPASAGVQVAANKRNSTLNDPADAVPHAEALAVVSIASITAGERMLTDTALQAVLGDHAAMAGHPLRCYNTISADAFSTALSVAPGIAEAYSAQAETRRFEAGADKTIVSHYSIRGRGVNKRANVRTLSAVLDAESVMRERRLEQLSAAGDALERRVQHHETTGRWAPLVHFMGVDKADGGSKYNRDAQVQAKMLDMGSVTMNLLMKRHTHQRSMNRRRSSVTVQASLHAPWKAEPIARIRDRLKIAGPPPAVSRKPVAHVAAGSAHTLMTLRSSSLLLSFGKGACGRLGHGDEFDRCRPRVVAMLQQLEIVQLAAGGAHSLVVDHAANVYAFGSDEHGQCGHADERVTKYLFPKRLEADALVMPPDEFGLKAPAPVMMVAAGDKHSAALVNDRQTPRYGMMFTWGQTEHGQCGFRDHQTDQGLPQRTPRCVMSMMHSEVTHVACGSRHTLCVAALGKKNEHRGEDLGVNVGQPVVYSWGCGENGQLGHGDTQNVRAPKVIATLVGVAVPRLCSAGSSHSLVLTQEGEVFSFGEGTNGRLGHGGYMYDGKMRSADCPIPRQIDKLRGYEAVAVAAGLHHSIVLVNTRVVSRNVGRKSPTIKHKHREAEAPKEFDGEGEVFAFGIAADGRLGVGLGPNLGPVHGRCCACGLEGHGERCDDSVREPRRLKVKSDALVDLAVQRIGAGYMSSVLVSSSGEIFSCGLSRNGRLGHGPPKPDAGGAHRHGGAHEFTLRRMDEFEAPSRDCPGFHKPF